MERTTEALALSHQALLGIVVATPIVIYLAKAIYNVFAHPLRHIPGPKINAISHIPYLRHHLDGSVADYLQALHAQYGEVVRYSPSEVSFITPESAWTDVYGFRTGKLKGHANTTKDPLWYAPSVNGSPSLILANDADHSRGRRILAHAFSDKALSAQEGLIQQYGDQLISRLQETFAAKPTTAVNLVRWYNWTTFDVIADLTFGEPFGCLRDLKTHRYVELLLNSVASARFFYLMHRFPITKYLGSLFLDKQALEDRKDFANWVYSQADKRMDRETDRPDFMTHILQHNDGPKGLSKMEIHSNASLFLGAGTETTATILSGVSYLLCQNERVMQKLKDEVRGRWKNYEDITLAEVAHAPYLLAVLQEGLRYYPPVPAGFNRVIPAGGEEVSGYYMPEGTSVTISQHASYHSPRNFVDPDEFVPERWMGVDEKYAADKREWVQPFSYGPRNCLGKNLAYAEMRLFLAKMIWSFDIHLQDESAQWMKNNKVMFLWVKPELMVNLTPVVRE